MNATGFNQTPSLVALSVTAVIWGLFYVAFKMGGRGMKLIYDWADDPDYADELTQAELDFAHRI